MTDFARASDRATPGLERSSLGDWILRNGLGETGRANSAIAHGDPGRSITDAIDRMESWYVDRGRPPRVQVFDETDRAVSAELDRRGYATVGETDIVVAPAAEVVARVGARPFTVEVVGPMPAFLRSTLAERRAAEMLSAELDRWFVIAAQGGPVLASGMAVGDGELVGVFAMRTDPGHQGNGAGSAVMAGLLAEGLRRGATTAWLQVEAANHRAADWYRRLGFERRTGYRYRRRDT